MLITIFIWTKFCLISSIAYQDNWITQPTFQTNKQATKQWNGGRFDVSRNSYVVAILKRSDHKIACGGSLLTVNAILTACRCLLDDYNGYWPTDKFYASAGSPNMSNANKLVRHFKQFVVHEECYKSSLSILSDVGLAFVMKSFILNKKVNVARFISTNKGTLWWWYKKFLFDGEICHIPGWNYDSVITGNLQNMIQDGQIILLDEQKCTESACGNHKICGDIKPRRKRTCGLPREGSPICDGNFGGPLICNQFIFSVVSKGPHKCTTYVPEKTRDLLPSFFCDPLTILDFIKYHIPEYVVPSHSLQRHPLSNVQPLKYPYIVSIANITNDYTPESLCAGSILTASSVISTCACLRQLSYSHNKRQYLNVAVISGITDLFEESQFARKLSIGRIALDCQDEEKGSVFYDVGIAFVNGEFPFTMPHVQPLKMPLDLQKDFANMRRPPTKCFMATWGYNVEKPTQLRYNLFLEWEVRLLNPQTCQDALCTSNIKICEDMISSNKALCGTAYNDSQRCFGDSGGPLVCAGQIFGLVHFNGELCSPGNKVKIISIAAVYDFVKRVSDYKSIAMEPYQSDQIRPSSFLIWNYFFLVIPIAFINSATIEIKP